MKIHIREHEAPEMFFSMLNFGDVFRYPRDLTLILFMCPLLILRLLFRKIVKWGLSGNENRTPVRIRMD